ncbi:hypothetical protein ACT6NV_02825 [Robiginitalea sp. IMCC44478]|uniref:hypothetical protein n=1 Tax=Robiginitalea sp. IMCC44478 TaxID=3459122 RepID=UPI004041FE95
MKSKLPFGRNASYTRRCTILELKNQFTFIITLLFFAGCNSFSEKRYEDYDEKDFIEVQGILVKSFRNTVYPDGFEADLYFIYNLDKDKPDTGYEKGTPYLGLHDGDPITVLVHNENPKISFYGSSGIIEEEVLLEYLDKCAQLGGEYHGVDMDLSKF